jgi:hypothetical protein
MKNIASKALLTATVVALWSLDFAPETNYLPVLANSAHAVFGRPLSPVSVAGVARRSTRRSVAASSSSQQQAQQPQPAAASALPTGTVVSALPSGCSSMDVQGVSMFNCAGVMYQPTFQSNNLVYVVK